MDYASALAQAGEYAETFTAFATRDQEELQRRYAEITAWFQSLPQDYENESMLVRKYACDSHYGRWSEQHDLVFRCISDISGFEPRVEDSIFYGWIYRNACRVANLIGMLSEAIDYGYKAADLIEKSQNKIELCKIYNLIGVCFDSIEYYDVSYDFYRKGYELAIETDNFSSMVIGLENMGYAKIMTGQLDRASELLLSAKALLDKDTKRQDLYIQIYNNLALVALRRERFAEAHDMIGQAKKHNEKEPITTDVISILQVESEILVKERRISDAIRVLLDALEIAVTKKLYRYELKIEKSLVDAFALERRFEEALSHQRRCQVLQENTNAELARSQFKYMKYQQKVRESRVVLERNVNELKLAQAKLRDSDTKYRTLFDSADDAVLLISDGICVDCNITATKLFDCPRESIVGSNPNRFTASGRKDGKTPRSLFEDRMRLALDGVPQAFEWIFQRANRVDFDAEVSVKKLDISGKPYLQILIRDVSEQKATKAALMHTQALNNAIVESTNDLIWSVDSKKFGLLTYNASLFRHFQAMGIQIGYGMRPEDMIDSEDFMKTWHSYYKRAVQKGPFVVEYATFNRKTSLLLSFGVLKNSGKVYGISVFGKDITSVNEYKTQLEKTNQVLMSRFHQTIDTIAKIVEMRDAYTAGHQKQVARLACAIARELGLSEEVVDNISCGAMIHDIGKIYIPSDILNKPGRLTSIEFQIIQTHTELGYEIIKDIDFPEEVKTMVLQHQERLDGSGYPQKLSGDSIILESRILSVADVVEAMSSHRPYRPALGIEAALNEIRQYRGTRYDERVVDACLTLFREKQYVL